jgi:hypothetical protein
MNVRRWDNMVHIVAEDEPRARQVYGDGRPAPTAHIVTAICGRRAKINEYSRNKLTEDAPTCFACIAGEIKDEQG